uniref:DUS-like FMN-binding domain-containing protein n=1 Tax=Leucosporidium scottii TaxID=5278 RepID=A0A0H5G9W3_9BASI|nr:hypothetical protein ls5930a1_00130 [Leucosporidium scottii]
MLSQFERVNVCAPMVRYSKLAFRQLVSQYETHITTTPMMLAKEFSRSAIARDSDFSTNSLERGTFYMEEVRRGAPVVELDESPEPRGILSTPRRRRRKVRGSLIVQFAANDGQQLADAAELVKPWVDGIDLNCGCPQKWAYQEGIGCALLRKPELVRDLVRSTKQRVGWDFPVSVKIRVDPDLTLTNELVRTAIAAGADILTVHGRTRHQSSSGHPVNLESLAFAVECAKGDIPCMANGDVFTLDDAEETRRRCNVRGVMSARGLLANPEFTRLSTSLGLIYPLFHRHVSYMLESHLPRKRDRTYFNSLSSHAGVMDYLEEEMGLDLRGGKNTGLEKPLSLL